MLSLYLSICCGLESQLTHKVIYQNRLRPIRSSGYQAYSRSRFLFNEAQIVTRSLGQFVECFYFVRRRSPARHLAIDAFNLFVAACLRRHLVGFFSVDLISHAHWNLSQMVEHIKLGNHPPGNAINHASVTELRQIEPPGAARPPGNGAEFVAPFAQVFTFSPK